MPIAAFAKDILFFQGIQKMSSRNRFYLLTNSQNIPLESGILPIVEAEQSNPSRCGVSLAYPCPSGDIPLLI